VSVRANYPRYCNNKDPILLAFERSFLSIFIAANLLNFNGVKIPINKTNNATNKLSKMDE
jgi:hypothetical protein